MAIFVEKLRSEISNAQIKFLDEKIKVFDESDVQ